MIRIIDVKQLHLEVSSLCNARCPLCPRALFSFPYNNGYTEQNLNLDFFKNRLPVTFIQQLEHLLLNGNFGDFLLNPQSIDILQYFRSINPSIDILISTNGSARSDEFWQELGTMNVAVQFCLDGLEDTHTLYRVDTNWKTIIRNAKTFMDAGGYAIWKMIPFDHNKHQIDDCRALAKELGFFQFKLNDQGRDKGPVYDRKGNLTHIIGDPWIKEQKIDNVISIHEKDIITKIPPVETLGTPSCETKNKNTVYISAEGKLYPCCYLGFSPSTYNFFFNSFVNRQIKGYQKNNDLHVNTLEEAFAWFSDVEESWKKPDYTVGRLLQCDLKCNGCSTK